MTAPLKVVELPLVVIAAILERADIPAQAMAVEIGRDSPSSRPRQLLPSGIIAALRRAQSGELIGDRQMVALRPDEAPVLNGWLRDLAVQPNIAEADRARFRAAADTIDQATP